MWCLFYLLSPSDTADNSATYFSSHVLKINFLFPIRTKSGKKERWDENKIKEIPSYLVREGWRQTVGVATLQRNV